MSLLALLGAVTALVLLGIGRFAWLSVPMIEWLRAAHDSPGEFTAAFPLIALHLALWSTVVGAAYMTAKCHHP